MHPKKQTIVYFDGLNLQHKLEETHPHLMWLDLVRLAKIMLGKHHTISQVKYYGARFNSKKKAKLQKTYLDALTSHAPKIEIHYGEFRQQIKPVKLANARARGLPEFADALITEEKKTDVNLAVHLVRDAFLNRFEAAAIVTNDTDFVEAIRIVREEVGLPVYLLSPAALSPERRWAHGSLRHAVTKTKHITAEILKLAQFPRIITTRDSQRIIRPHEWD